MSGEIPATAAVTGSVAAPQSFGFNRNWIWGSFLVLAVILTYSPVWWAGYSWDDDLYVTANPVIIGPLGLKEIWTTSAADICPLTITTFWVEHALWGLAPLPYHLVNVLLHGACAILLWRVLRSLRVPGAWLGAALWALHPVEGESVAWISETKNTQSGLFFLLSILFFLRWLKARDLDGRTSGRWNYALTLIFAALAMASKSSTVILPVVLILCAWWVEGRWQWRNVARVVPIFLMSAAAGALAIWKLGLQLAIASDPQFVRTWPQRLVTAGDAVWFYLGKLLWPHPLITIYPRWQIDASQWFSYLPLLAVIIVLFILWLKREAWSRPAFFASTYFLVALFPVLGLGDNPIFRYSLVFDHFQYLASMGPLAAAGAGMARLADFIIPERTWLRSSLYAGLLLILGVTSWQRAWVYESEETLWIDTLAKNPNCWLGYNNLGNLLLQKGQVNEAIACLHMALKINPNYAEAYGDLGAALLQTGQEAEAMEQFKQALRIQPDDVAAHGNLGNALLQTGRVAEAMEQYKQALQIKPDDAAAHDNLANALWKIGRVPEAIGQFEQALQLNPDDAKAYYNLGVVLTQSGQVDAAIAQFEKALEIAPDFALAHNNLGNVFLQKRQVDEAIAQYQKAIEIDPNFDQVHNNLGVALAQKGRLGEAIVQFQEALRLNPNNTDAQNSLAKVQAAMRQGAGQK